MTDLVVRLNQASSDCAADEHQIHCVCDVAQDSLVEIVKLRAKLEVFEALFIQVDE
jgi:hypothetical protein